ncbi:MAG: hypothetical protein EOM59_05895 [Clostridia bacterium]|nr:hypothetical protein [Clostridia bacterium]
MSKTPQEDLKDQQIYSNLLFWHQMGFTGRDVVIWNMENSRAEHGKMTTIRIKHAAPDADVINASLSMSYNGKEVKYSHATLDDGTKIETEEFIKTRGIKLITRSVGGGTATDTVASRYWNELKDKYNLIFFNSAGNDGSDGAGGSLPPDVAIYVAACGLDKHGKPRRDNYSAIGKEVDFIDFRGFYSGTSFAAPYLCGKAALLIHKYGHDMTQDDVYAYFKTHAEDIESAGQDDMSGWGLPIMGDPNTKIELQVGSKLMYVDSRKVELDQGPVIQNGRTLVPIRAIAEALGAKVDWDENAKTVTIYR